VTRRWRERGYSLVAVMAAITIMSIATAIALPAWKYVIKNEREQELIFRGGQIADAVRRFQTKNGNALPASLDVLVKGRFLRKAYKDPMTSDGQWKLVRQGEAMPGGGGTRPPGTPSPSPGAVPSPSPSPSSGSLLQRAGTATGTPGSSVGVFIGVASRSAEKSIRLFNNRDRYDQWWFVAGQPRVVGRQLVSPAQVGQPGRPGQQPQQGPLRR